MAVWSRVSGLVQRERPTVKTGLWSMQAQFLNPSLVLMQPVLGVVLASPDANSYVGIPQPPDPDLYFSGYYAFGVVTFLDPDVFPVVEYDCTICVPPVP